MTAEVSTYSDAMLAPAPKNRVARCCHRFAGKRIVAHAFPPKSIVVVGSDEFCLRPHFSLLVISRGQDCDEPLHLPFDLA
jgi:hypothetical protein